MNSTSQVARRPSSVWIISPIWDMAYLVATPLAIVPIVWILANRVTSPTLISLVVASFATFGHHLPGFMRCYGDRDLFVRFKRRFILAPIVFGATALSFALLGLHGLTLVLLIWGTWHGLMQTYGFMRIYDLKRGDRDKWTGRLDFWLCMAVFGAGMIFSDGRMVAVMESLWMSGVPYIDSVWLLRLRWMTGLGLALVTVAYVVNIIRQSSSSYGVSWTKVALAVTTGGLYWFTGAITTNVLIGIAMFEIFHALQYYAIVWTYNRRLAQRVGPKFGPLGFMFQDRWFFLGIYLSMIALFSSIRFFSDGVNDPTFKRIFLTLFSTSTLLHFYYDGFIWKVREKKTQDNLDIVDLPKAPRQFEVPVLAHLGKWGLLYVVLIGLLGMELFKKQTIDAKEMAVNLEQWAPNLPEVQSRVSELALQDGDAEKAIRLASNVAMMRPRMANAHSHLANSLLTNRRYKSAVESFQKAIQLAPDQWENYYGLSQAWEGLGKWDDADKAMRHAIDLNPSNAELWHDLGSLFVRQGKHVEALPHFEKAQELDTDSDRFRTDLAMTYFTVGVSNMANEQFDDARLALEKVVKLLPDSAEAYSNLGYIYFRQHQDAKAEKAYRRATEIKPELADPHYNLGLLLLEQGKLAKARQQIQRAAQLGLQPSNEVRAELGL